MNLHLDQDINEDFPLEQFLFANKDSISVRIQAQLRGIKEDNWDGHIDATTKDTVNNFEEEEEMRIGFYQGLEVSIFVNQYVTCSTDLELECKLYDFSYSVDYLQIGCNGFEIPKFMSEFIINEIKKLN